MSLPSASFTRNFAGLIPVEEEEGVPEDLVDQAIDWVRTQQTLKPDTPFFAYLPFGATRLPLQENLTIEWGVGVGIAMLAVMLLGGAIGGALGARWHSRLEEETIRAREEEERRRVAEAARPPVASAREHEAPPRSRPGAEAGPPPPPEEGDRTTAQALKDKLSPAAPREEERERGRPAP